MNFLLLWLECTSMLLLWIALAIALDAHLPPGLRRWVSVIGLAGIAVVAAFEITGTLGVALALKLSFAVGFFISVALVFVAGSAWLAWKGLRASAPGLAPPAAEWPWRRLALLLAIATGLAAVTLHDMRISSEQELSHDVADLRELMHQLDPPVPASLNAEPLYETAWKHLIAVDQVPGARAALDAVETSPTPSAAQLLAPPLTDWEQQNAIALALVVEATQHPAYSSLEETTFRAPPIDEESRIAKVADLELNQTRPDTRVIGHLTERGRAAHLLGLQALRDAAGGQRAQAVDELNALFVLARHGHYATPPAEETLAKLLATHALTDAELKHLNLRAEMPLKTRLQLELLVGELRDLEGLAILESGSWTQPSGRSNSFESAGTALLDLSRGFIDVLGTHALIERNRDGYDDLWKALYAAPGERFSRLDALARSHRSLFFESLAFRQLFISQTAAEARRACAELGVAIARYQLANGQPPKALADLVPTFLLEVPADPFNGQPLRYRLEPGTALIYSVGPDLKDDGARPISDADSRRAGATGDLVFRVDTQTH